MIVSPNLVRLIIIAVVAVGSYGVLASVEQKHWLKVFGIVITVTILLVIFGADFLALLINNVRP